MNKYVFNILTNLLDEIKQFKKYENLDKISAVLNNEIISSKCKAVIINDSSKADAFYGLIVYPNINLGDSSDTALNIKDYVIEIQKSLLDVLDAGEIAVMIIHDISHNILTTTVAERFKLAIYKACRMTNTKIVEIIHNIETRMYNIAILDISNRTYKDILVPGLDLYEPDRILVDMNIWKQWNSALEKIKTNLQQDNLSNPDYQETADLHIGLKIVKMVQEKIREISSTYDQLLSYVMAMYDTKIFTYYPAIVAKITYDIYGEDVSGTEPLKPLELQFLHEHTVDHIRLKGNSMAATILESVFDKPGQISYSALQKEFDIINFKMDAISSNYERLAILDRIYDNIFALEKYINKNSNYDMTEPRKYLEKFIKLTSILKDAKVAKKRYDIFIEVPPGYEG